MFTHLTPSDYVIMPWANGMGVTTELFVVKHQSGVKWRISRASVTQEGDFSLFPGLDRNLTVISGPGFEIEGRGLHLHAKPFMPVSFRGDVAVRATNVFARSDDLNVMTARFLPSAEVWVFKGRATIPAHETLALFAMCTTTVQIGDEAEVTLQSHDLLVTDQAVTCDATERVVAIRLFG
jgi:environmental stress-induced protein Ves